MNPRIRARQPAVQQRMNRDTHSLHRRDFLKTSAFAGLGLAAALAPAADEPKPQRKFTLCFAPGPIGVPGDPRKAVGWASQFGFESIEPAAQFLGKLSDAELQDYLGEMKTRKLAWGCAGLPVEFRGAEAAFEQSMKALPEFARALQRAGVTRVATWLSPGSKSLTYVANFRQHAKRLREVARVLGEHGLRLGLEYVGPKTSWSASRFPFIHTMAEMKDLIAEIGRDNVGFLLDSWHWYTAQETEADLLTLKASDVVLCHLNDAPQGVAVDQQIDNRRGLPCATGVIDVKTFLGAMVKIGYDGPVVCEPFSQELRNQPPEQVLATVAAAMKKAVALLDLA
ncbi:MAG: sugar phosphate isomerase/epimerase [Verrucomicrobia bacterium]|nr:sugar phosphate isomerase/epimerase [Verrucomicrobiota bacterium]